MKEPTCPRCSAQFDSWAKLRHHHTTAHGESLPNTKCENCGNWFFSEYAKDCSDECRYSCVSFKGENNPMYTGGKKPTECKICGVEFTYYPSHKPGDYCSACVEKEDWRHRPTLLGSDHSHWKGGNVDLTCDVCGKPFDRRPCEIVGEATLCSRECHSEWLSDAFLGECHPNWKGGSKDAYGKGWSRIRRLALDRDDYQCVVCGKTKEAIGRNPDVHHIIPVRAFIESELLLKAEAHTLDNVVSLCIDCHRKADFGRISKAELRTLIALDPQAPLEGR